MFKLFLLLWLYIYETFAQPDEFPSKLNTILGLHNQAGSPIELMTFPSSRERNVNISAIRYTMEAYAARLKPSVSEESPPKFLDNVASYSESSVAATYMLWGDNDAGGSVNGKDQFAAEEDHFINLSDLCAVRDAFIGLVAGSIRCFGKNETCHGVKELAPGIDKVRVFCIPNLPAAVVELQQRYVDPDDGFFYYVIGSQKYIFPTEDTEIAALNLNEDETKAMNEFKKEWKNLDRDFVQAVYGYDDAIAVQTRSGRVLSWKDKKPFLLSNNEFVIYATKMAVNNIGFTALLTTGNVQVWGDNININNPPNSVTDDTLRDPLVDVYGYDQCFAGYTTNKAVHTWGIGMHSWCQESGAVNINGYTPYRDYINDITSDVAKVIGNDKSFAVIKDNGTVIVWGSNGDGGSKIPPVDLPSQWKPDDIKYPKPESIVATSSAYAFIRRDGRVILWGNRLYGGLADTLYTHLATEPLQLVASRTRMAVITKEGGIAFWPGRRVGYYNQESTSPIQLPHKAKYAVPVREGIIFILGYDCIYSEWSEWAECNAPCGNGTRLRSRQIKEYALNGDCDFAFTESESCFITDCSSGVTTLPPRLSVVSMTVTLTIIFVAVGVVLTLYCMYRKTRSQNQWDDYSYY